LSRINPFTLASVGPKWNFPLASVTLAAALLFSECATQQRQPITYLPSSPPYFRKTTFTPRHNGVNFSFAPPWLSVSPFPVKGLCKSFFLPRKIGFSWITLSRLQLLASSLPSFRERHPEPFNYRLKPFLPWSLHTISSGVNYKRQNFPLLNYMILSNK